MQPSANTSLTLSAGARPFSTVLVLDEVGGVADAIVRCTVCALGRTCSNCSIGPAPTRATRRYRTSIVDETHPEEIPAQPRTRQLRRQTRAGRAAELRKPREVVAHDRVELDAKDLRALGVETVAADADIPMSSWRERLR